MKSVESRAKTHSGAMAKTLFVAGSMLELLGVTTCQLPSLVKGELNWAPAPVESLPFVPVQSDPV